LPSVPTSTRGWWRADVDPRGSHTTPRDPVMPSGASHRPGFGAKRSVDPVNASVMPRRASRGGTFARRSSTKWPSSRRPDLARPSPRGLTDGGGSGADHPLAAAALPRRGRPGWAASGAACRRAGRPPRSGVRPRGGGVHACARRRSPPEGRRNENAASALPRPRASVGVPDRARPGRAHRVRHEGALRGSASRWRRDDPRPPVRPRLRPAARACGRRPWARGWPGAIDRRSTDHPQGLIRRALPRRPSRGASRRRTPPRRRLARRPPRARSARRRRTRRT
jgi:hypothetical protein